MKYHAIAVVLALACSVQARTWTSVSGKTVEAEFVALQGANVVLQTPDGQKLSVGLGALSRADQEFVHSQKASAAAPGAPTAESLGLPAETPSAGPAAHGAAGRPPALGAPPVPGGIKPSLPSAGPRHGTSRRIEPAAPSAESLGVAGPPAVLTPAAPTPAAPAAPGAPAAAVPAAPAGVAPLALPHAGRPAAGKKGADAVLTAEQIAALQKEVVLDEKTGDKIEFVGGMSPKKRLGKNEKEWKEGDAIPVRITCELTLVRQKKEETDRKRVTSGKVRYYLQDDTGAVIDTGSESLEALAPDGEKGIKIDVTKPGKYTLVMYGDYKEKAFGLKEVQNITPPKDK